FAAAAAATIVQGQVDASPGVHGWPATRFAVSAQLLEPLGAEVAVFVFAPRAARTDPEAQDGLQALREEASQLLAAVDGNWLGGLPANLSDGIEKPRSAAKGEIFNYIQHDRWRCPHLPLELLEATFSLDDGRTGRSVIWIPESGWDDYGGIYDNHAVLDARSARTFLGGWQQILRGETISELNIHKGGFLNPEVFLLVRVKQNPAIAVRRYVQCAFRTCSLTGSQSWARSQCDPGTGARYEYPFEWAAAEATASCFEASMATHSAPVGRETGWTWELMGKCYGESAPFPEDLGFRYPAASGAAEVVEDEQLCLQSFKTSFFTDLSGSAWFPIPRCLWHPRGFSDFEEKRHECRTANHNYLGVHAEFGEVRRFGLCVPASCPVYAWSVLATSFIAHSLLYEWRELGLARTLADIYLAITRVDVQDISGSNRCRSESECLIKQLPWMPRRAHHH
ncbi:unnamed protein product, partial [Polarella glacialis]